MTRFLDAVLFDLDLTLGRPVGDMSFSARQAALYASVGLPYTEADLVRAADERRAAIQAGRLRGVIRAQRMRDLLTAYRQILTLLGYQGDVRAKAHELYEGYARLPFVPYDDACPTLEALTARCYRLGIISNHTPIARPVVEAAFGNLIPPRRILISGEQGVHKPRASLFRRGAARVGVPPERCAFVGDNLHVDAEAAVAAGYGLGVWVDREGEGPRPLRPFVTRIIQLADLVPLLDRVAPDPQDSHATLSH